MPAHLTRRPEKALTAQTVKSATAPGKYFDGHGLYLRVEPNGTKFWVQRIVIRGKRSEIGLGPATLVSLAEARAAALDNRKLARAGGDPLQAKREAAAVLTFEEAARKVHALHLPTWRNEKHGRDFITSLELYAFPRLGKLNAADVTTADVLGVLMPIWTEKAETARRVRQRIGTVMKWAIAQGWRQDNPAENISKALPKVAKVQAHRKALGYGEVAGCIAAVQASRAGMATKLALEFLVLTAARSGEVREARWSEIDLAATVWEVPADRMKMKRAHRVPLSARAIAILEAAKGLDDGSGLLFPGTKQGRPLSDMTLSKLVKELGFDADVHGFRTSFRTWAQERTTFPREVAEAALAHLSGDAVERAYARSDVFEKRRGMMDRWAAFLSEKSEKVTRIG
ncbi:MAG: integrase arm-type DNA-binding domain-containing protein [Rhodobacter sp.]|uniref:tyrosine-type recombinase/integrase n=1 Tax=Pararhodobacter sp. TaxID=2127056 RepID=UPI002CCCB1EB|nr:integrase arm-type DNA-binding domain-containing protein [Pararhodobacter sp.]MCC0071777.1 integrase arm-type DNA-binding domain-containing protein [Rhodobacter sp.]HPD91065.1 integrase arm-type DNA-binding domain-containing protein [Pararhodobacter sp.]